MKTKKIINEYPKLKRVGAVSIERNSQNKKILVAKKYSQYTGEVVGQKMVDVKLSEIDSRISELEQEIDSLKELRNDLKKNTK